MPCVLGSVCVGKKVVSRRLLANVTLLGDVIDAAGRQPPDYVFSLAEPGHEDDGQVCEQLVVLQPAARFKAVRESQGLTLAEVAERMQIDPPALSRLETGKVLNPTLATLHKWAEALGQKLDVELSPG